MRQSPQNSDLCNEKLSMLTCPFSGAFQLALGLFPQFLHFSYSFLAESEVFPVHIGVNERGVLTCSLEEDATEILWQKDGQPYADHIIQPTLSHSEAQVEALPELNGSRFDCIASFGDRDETEVIKSWVVVVQESKYCVCKDNGHLDDKGSAFLTNTTCTFSVVKWYTYVPLSISLNALSPAFR